MSNPYPPHTNRLLKFTKPPNDTLRLDSRIFHDHRQKYLVATRYATDEGMSHMASHSSHPANRTAQRLKPGPAFQTLSPGKRRSKSDLLLKPHTVEHTLTAANCGNIITVGLPGSTISFRTPRSSFREPSESGDVH